MQRAGAMQSDSPLAARSIRWLLLVGFACSCILVPRQAAAARLTISWTDRSDGTARTRVERRLADATATYAQIADIEPGVTTYVDASVDPGTAYCYRTRAYEADGVSSYSDEACATSSYDGYQLSVTIKKAGTGGGTVVTSPRGMECGSACSGTFLASTSITLVAVPARGSTFVGWSGGGCAGTGTCVLAGNTSLTVTATFRAAR